MIADRDQLAPTATRVATGCHAVCRPWLQTWIIDSDDFWASNCLMSFRLPQPVSKYFLTHENPILSASPFLLRETEEDCKRPEGHHCHVDEAYLPRQSRHLTKVIFSPNWPHEPFKTSFQMLKVTPIKAVLIIILTSFGVIPL